MTEKKELVTEVVLRKIDHDYVKARGHFVLSNKIQISCSVIKGTNGLFVSLPSHKGKSREGGERYYNDVYIKDEQMFQTVTNVVLGKFSALTSEASGVPETSVSSDANEGKGEEETDYPW